MNKKITLKELYTELIVIQTEIKMIKQNQIFSKKYYTRLLLIILSTIMADILIHFILFNLSK